eukprot:6106065-Amphidinium_carterae.1
MTQLKHLLKYINGTKDFTIQLQPKHQPKTQQGLIPLSITTFSDRDWAGEQQQENPHQGSSQHSSTAPSLGQAELNQQKQHHQL